MQKTTLEIHFIYLGNKKFAVSSRHAAKSLFSFPQNAMQFKILSFSVQVACFS